MATSFDTTARFSFGTTVSDMFSAATKNFPVMALLAIVLYGLPSTVYSLFLMQSMSTAFTSLTNPGNIFGGMFYYTIFGGSLLLLVFYILAQGSITHVALSSFRNQKASFGEALGAALRSFFPLLGIALIFYISVIVLYIAIFAALFGLIGVGGQAGNIGVAGSIGVFFLFMFFFVVPIGFLGVVWLVPVPAYMAERKGVFASLGRSWSLTSGHRWKLFGMIALFLFALMIFYGTISAVGTPFVMMGTVGGATGPDDIFNVMLPITLIQSLLGSLMLVLIFPAVVATYVNLRRSKEGIGLESIEQVFG